MKRVSDYRAEIIIACLITVSLVPILFGIFQQEIKGFGPFVVGIIIAIILYGLALFLRFAVKIYFIDTATNYIFIRNVFSKSNIESLHKSEIKNFEMMGTIVKRLEITTLEDRIYYSYISVFNRKLVDEFLRSF